MTATRERSWMCTGCGYVMDASSCPADPKQRPQPGDISLCLACGKVYLRAAEAWRAASPRELRRLSAQDRESLAKIESARRMVTAAFGPLAGKRAGHA